MTEFQTQMLIGCSLGDITWRFINNKARFSITHTDKHKEYVFHKYELLKEFCKTKPRIRIEEKWSTYNFNSLLKSEFMRFKMFFNGNKRGVPENIGEFLTPVSLAYWFMDDGTSTYTNIVPRLKTRKPYVILCTDRYAYEDVRALCFVLRINFDLGFMIKHSASMVKKDGSKRYRLYLGTGDTPKFFNIIRPFIVPVMGYKLKENIPLLF